MSKEAPWIRWAVDWANSEMFSDLGPGPMLAWVALVTQAKQIGRGGKFRPDMLMLTHRYPIDAQDVAMMLQAAERHGAITRDGDAVALVNWDTYQNDSATKMARYRENKAARSGGSNEGNKVTKVTRVTYPPPSTLHPPPPTEPPCVLAHTLGPLAGAGLSSVVGTDETHNPPPLPYDGPGSTPATSGGSEPPKASDASGGIVGQSSQKPTKRRTTPGFDSFYRPYPVHKGPDDAERKFAVAVRRVMASDPDKFPTPTAAAAFLAERAAAYAASDEGRSQYAPHPSTWLHQGRYFDDPATWNRRAAGVPAKGAVASFRRT